MAQSKNIYIDYEQSQMAWLIDQGSGGIVIERSGTWRFGKDLDGPLGVNIKYYKDLWTTSKPQALCNVVNEVL